MKIRPRPLSLSLLFLQLLPLAHATIPPGNTQGSVEKKVLRDVQQKQGPDPTLAASLLTKPTALSVVGTKDAPVDGKDGKPHAGPFVETAAERDRKKAKENGGEDALLSGKKPLPNDKAKGDSHISGWDTPIPESNDGVMDDPSRRGPREGTRGTEGGISEKTRDKKLQEDQEGTAPEKVPEKPKGVPPLPHNDQEHTRMNNGKEASKPDKGDTKGHDEKSDDKAKEEVGGLKVRTQEAEHVPILDANLVKKPTDLPDKPHDIPHPIPPSASKDDALEISKPQKPVNHLPSTEPTTLIQPLHSFLLSFIMIIFSEIGDKTFLVAALMAMKHPPLFVFSASFPAMIVMTVLSVVLGHAVPTLIPKQYTQFAAALLFLVFGAKMLREGYQISPGEGVGQEMKEVEMELEEKEERARKMGRRRSSITPYMLEGGRIGTRKSRSNSRLPAPPASPPSSSDSRSPSPNRSSTLSNVLTGVNNLFSLLLSPAWVQTFAMTFLGEWGDRSQIATIAMAAGQDYWWVTGGALTGHAICIAIAVMGGRAIAGRVSLRVGKYSASVSHCRLLIVAIVTLSGGFAFLIFGIIYLAEAMWSR